MRRHNFPLFNSHLDLAHNHWSNHLKIGDIVVDATCGNGHDTLFLSKTVLSSTEGKVYGLDIQNDSIKATASRLEEALPKEFYVRTSLQQSCHSSFPTEIKRESVSLIAYNLGYLPGGDKTCTTLLDTTLQSLEAAQQLLRDGGMISVTCYPGHTEGEEEEGGVLRWAASLDSRNWSCCYHKWVNRFRSPSLLLIQKNGFVASD